jgi:hypothetical protein
MRAPFHYNRTKEQATILSAIGSAEILTGEDKFGFEKVSP